MKKLIFVVLAMFAICSTSVNAQESVTYFYAEDYCQDVYERYIPSGYFSGPQGTRIHYYGNGDFFVGYETGIGVYQWEVVHMDFRPLHRMVLSRDRFGLAAIHILLVEGSWVWSISYDEYTYDNQLYPSIHYYGNDLNWLRCNSTPYSFVYYDWNYSYVDLVWRNNHRPGYHSNFATNHGDCRMHQYNGHSHYGYRSNGNGGMQRTYNHMNSNERRISSESANVGRDVLSREFETARRGYEVDRSSQTRQTTSTNSQYSRQSSSRVSNVSNQGRSSVDSSSVVRTNAGGQGNLASSGSNRSSRTSTSTVQDGALTSTTTTTVSNETRGRSSSSSRTSTTSQTYDEGSDIRYEVRRTNRANQLIVTQPENSSSNRQSTTSQSRTRSSTGDATSASRTSGTDKSNCPTCRSTDKSQNFRTPTSTTPGSSTGTRTRTSTAQ